MNIETQKKRIKEQLIKGAGITPMHALNKYGCFRLSARIWELRNEGMNIITRRITHGGKSFAFYELAQ